MKTLLYLLFIFLFIHPANAYAEGNTNFSVSYDVLYTIHTDGTATITQKGLLTNTTDKQFVTSLTLRLNSPSIGSVSAYDEIGTITPKVAQKNNSTDITLNFNKQILGLGKNLNFTLNYTRPDIVKKDHDTNRLIIPAAENNAYVVAYNVHVAVPEEFGRPVRVDPSPASPNTWNKEQLQNGIKLLYVNPTAPITKTAHSTRSSLSARWSYIFYSVLLIVLLILIISVAYFIRKHNLPTKS